MKTIFRASLRGCLQNRNPAFVTVLLLASVLTPTNLIGGQEGTATTNSVAVDAGKAINTTPNKAATTLLSQGVVEIVKMADAGVSMEVIKTYIESSPKAFAPTDDDVIALKKHNVGDDVVTLLLKRGAEARAKATAAKNEAVAQVLSSRRASSGGFEPESYDYFRYYYLQPRALASANQRLYPYYGPYFSRPYAYGPIYGYGAPTRSYYRGYR
jgi:hypothetical protein